MDAAYLAGFFDGEGNVGTKRGGKGGRSISLRIQISQKDPGYLRSLQREFGGSLFLYGARRDAWLLSINRTDDARRFIETIRPYSRLKAGSLDIALALLSTQTRKRLTPTAIAERERLAGMLRVRSSSAEIG